MLQAEKAAGWRCSSVGSAEQPLGFWKGQRSAGPAVGGVPRETARQREVGSLGRPASRPESGPEAGPEAGQAGREAGLLRTQSAGPGVGW